MCIDLATKCKERKKEKDSRYIQESCVPYALPDALPSACQLHLRSDLFM